MTNKSIRALYDEHTITIYQAFNKEIASTAVQHQTFISPPFKKERMTWIKPSFLWMMYRSGWATKENQEHILAIKMSREGFEYALENSCLTKIDIHKHQSIENWRNQLNENPVRIQWDPDRDILLQPLTHKAIQIGLSGIVLKKYMQEWIISITDITNKAKEIYQLVMNNEIENAKKLLPHEMTYPTPDNILIKII